MTPFDKAPDPRRRRLAASQPRDESGKFAEHQGEAPPAALPWGSTGPHVDPRAHDVVGPLAQRLEQVPSLASVTVEGGDQNTVIAQTHGGARWSVAQDGAVSTEINDDYLGTARLPADGPLQDCFAHLNTSLAAHRAWQQVPVPQVNQTEFSVPVVATYQGQVWATSSVAVDGRETMLYRSCGDHVHCQYLDQAQGPRDHFLVTRGGGGETNLSPAFNDFLDRIEVDPDAEPRPVEQVDNLPHLTLVETPQAAKRRETYARYGTQIEAYTRGIRQARARIADRTEAGLNLRSRYHNEQDAQEISNAEKMLARMGIDPSQV